MQVRTKREWIARLTATAVLLLGMVPLMYLWMYLSQFVGETMAVVIVLIPLGVLLFWSKRLENWLKHR
jgi:hypothetical protein